jgi:hypothetical protein
MMLDVSKEAAVSWKTWSCISILGFLLAACGQVEMVPPPQPTAGPTLTAPAAAAAISPTETPVSTATPAAPTAVAPTIPAGPCPGYDQQSSTEFLAAVECGLQRMDAAYLQGLMDDPVYLQSCLGAACGMFYRNYAAADVMHELQVRLGRLGVDPTAKPLATFTVHEDDTSAFPQTPMMASSALVAASSDGSWTLYVGYDTSADKYVITDMLLDVGAGMAAAPSPVAAATPVITPTHPDWVVYHDPAGFSIEHPADWKQLEGKAPPVIFEADVPPGTTLSRKSMRISVFETAGADCTDPYSTFGQQTGAPQAGTVNGIAFLKESSGDQAMNQIHNWTSYSTLKGTTCISIALVLDSTNVGVYSTEPAPYDPAKESAVFDEVLKTFRFDQ